LDEYYVEGIQTNLSFFKTILRYPDFLEGRLDTGLIDRLLSWEQHIEELSGAPASHLSREALEAGRLKAAALAAALFATGQQRVRQQNGQPATAPDSRWKLEGRRHLLRQWPLERK
ncbi:MAG: hypothetical protein HYX73_05895, partial [Acidobacteria bacterium]|nr:hypothetical protein [Acidobacteriota bacterium]